MNLAEAIVKIKSYLDNASSVLVLCPANATREQVVSAFAIQQALKLSGKEASLYSPAKPFLPEYPHVTDSTRTELGNQNLVISFEYSPQTVDKVSYHIGEDSNKFYLTIKPQKGSEPPDSSGVEFSYSGAEADLIICVGVANLENLEQLYYGYEDLYEQSPLIGIDSKNISLGTINIDKSNHLSEQTANIIRGLGLAIDPDSATMLLREIDGFTNKLQDDNITAETLETFAYLMRSGAVRQPAQGLRENPDADQLVEQETATKPLTKTVKQSSVREFKVANRERTRLKPNKDGVNKSSKKQLMGNLNSGIHNI